LFAPALKTKLPAGRGASCKINLFPSGIKGKNRLIFLIFPSRIKAGLLHLFALHCFSKAKWTGVNKIIFKRPAKYYISLQGAHKQYKAPPLVFIKSLMPEKFYLS
jgi:hypothetical protein